MSDLGAGRLVPGGGRALEALKAEVAARAARAAPPLSGVDLEAAHAALARIDSLDRDTWAHAFSAIARDHLDRARALEATDRDGAAAAYWQAWRLYHYARWPVENTAVRRDAQRRALEAFRCYARLLDPPMETLRVPFDGGTVVAYLRAPRGAPAPVVLALSGLDSRKEDIAAHTERYLAHGLAVVAVDMPGTGEAPARPADRAPERMYGTLIDYLLTRRDLDATRLVVQGRSFSGYWAAKLAYLERERLRGAVVHGGPIHHTFHEPWFSAALETGEYLYDYVEAWRAMLGAATREDLQLRAGRLSLRDMGLLDAPSAPMLLVNGARDSQIAIADLFLLLRHGDAKSAWVNPAGGHMGRSAQWPPAAIAEQVLMPWMAARLRD